METEKTVTQQESLPKNEERYVTREQFEQLSKKFDELSSRDTLLNKTTPSVSNEDYTSNRQYYQEEHNQLPTIDEAHKLEQEQLVQRREMNKHELLTGGKYAGIPTEENIRFWKENTIIEFFEANKENLKGFDSSIIEALKRCDYDFIARTIMNKNQRYQELIKEKFYHTRLDEDIAGDFAYNKVKNDYLTVEQRFLRYR